MPPDPSQPKVVVVMPAFNEAETLDPSVREVIDGLRTAGRDFEVVIVENGSTDETRAIAERLAVELDEVKAEHIDVGDAGISVVASRPA